jgi:hypothetical protein
MPQATPSLSPLNPVRLCFVSSLASQPPHLMGFFPPCRIGNPLRVLGSVTIHGRSLLIRTIWRVERTRLLRAGRRSPILSGHQRALLARQHHALEACLISSSSRPPL